ncbi:MAG: hypothetical protein LHW44_00215 [Candidatus Cloacimonetes bacterium]|nr:hypothetical protein [Candidatus Cloacimonadota bacterium]
MKHYLPLVCCLMLFLSACGGNKTRSCHPLPPPEIHTPFSAPSWLWQIPSGSYTIGFGYADTFFSNRADSLAREYAAVSLSRNHSSFVVDKKSIWEWASETQSSWESRTFQLVVSADLNYLKNSYQDLILIDHYHTQGYYIGLYGFSDKEVDAKPTIMHQDEKPDWCVDESITSKGNTIYCIASAQASSLMDAWSLAQEKALRLIGKYRLQKVQAVFASEDDFHKRDLAIETVARSYQAYLDKSFIIPSTTENQTSYLVYLQIRSLDH